MDITLSYNRWSLGGKVKENVLDSDTDKICIHVWSLPRHHTLTKCGQFRKWGSSNLANDPTQLFGASRAFPHPTKKVVSSFLIWLQIPHLESYPVSIDIAQSGLRSSSLIYNTVKTLLRSDNTKNRNYGAKVVLHPIITRRQHLCSHQQRHQWQVLKLIILFKTLILYGHLLAFRGSLRITDLFTVTSASQGLLGWLGFTFLPSLSHIRELSHRKIPFETSK